MSRRLTIWTIGGESTASTRLRIHQYLPRLAAEGIRPRVRAIPHGFLPRLPLFGGLTSSDRLLLQKKLFAGPELAWIAARAERLLYDVDDAVYLDGEGDRRNGDRFRRVTAAARRVLAGNATLAAACAEPVRAVLLPTPVDTDRVVPSPAGRRTAGLVAWIGSRAGLPSLNLVWPAWERVHPRRPQSQLVVMADRAPDRLPSGASFSPWSPESERALLGRATAGLMPLLDTPFNRGKCGFKILLYQAAGLPVVASPVGVNRELVRHGEDGFLAADAPEWERALDALLGDPRMALGFGEAGRARVTADYSVGALYPRFRDTLLEGWT